jgi:SAM-dependent methyltransferase
MHDLNIYFRGEAIYGDDFGPQDIAAWFRDEEEGYANLGAKDAGAYRYGYHALNLAHGYRHLPQRSFARVLGFGSAYGDELMPVVARAEHITVVDPSAAFVQDRIGGKPASYVKPYANGSLPLADDCMDLATCLGVLHHIPNVSFVLKELARVITPGGYLLLREPVISMGDWRLPRTGLTKRERGIPLHLLLAAAKDAGFVVQRQTLCAFPTTTRVFGRGGRAAYNQAFAVWVDRWMSKLFAFNLRYHPTSNWQKLRPNSVFLVLQKSGYLLAPKVAVA